MNAPGASVVHIVQCVGQIFADALAAKFFAHGTEAASHIGRTGCMGCPTPHCRDRSYMLEWLGNTA